MIPEHLLRDIDVVIQTLGVDFSPRLVFEGTKLFSESTRVLVDAMKAAGVKRLITVTGLGAGDSRGHGGLLYDAVVFPLLLKRVYDDKDVQEWIVRSSGFDWTIVRPGLLKDRPRIGLIAIRPTPAQAALSGTKLKPPSHSSARHGCSASLTPIETVVPSCTMAPPAGL